MAGLKLGQFAFCAETDQRLDVERTLLIRRDLVWPDSARAMDQAWSRLRNAISGPLPVLAIVASWLMEPERKPAWAADWVRNRISPSDWGLASAWGDLESFSWRCCPVALASDVQKQLLWFLVGSRPAASGNDAAPFPDWYGEITDGDALAASRKALELASRETGLTVRAWPVVRCLDRRIIYGTSLGLPLYLAAKDQQCPPLGRKILCTGAIGANGSLEAVSHLTEKAALLKPNGFEAILYPKSSEERLFTDSKAYQAASLWSAWELYDLFACSPEEDLPLLSECLRSPELFMRNVAALKSPFIRHASETGRLTVLAARMAGLDSGFWKMFLDSLDEGYKRKERQSDLKAILDSLDEGVVASLGERDEVAAFRLSDLKYAESGREGRLDETDRWYRMAQRYWATVLDRDPGGLALGFINHKLINLGHNRYRFSPDLPPEACDLQKGYEAVLKARRLHAPNFVMEPLGKFYGTLAQNFGFLGPEYVDKVRAHVRKAEDAFGKRNAKEYERDIRRCHSYLMYACLDAWRVRGGKWKGKAKQELLFYLGKDPWNGDAIPEQEKFEHAALARFAADTGDIPPGYLDSAARMLASCSGHPWQLWAYNMGRMLTGAQRLEAWKRSLDLCRNEEATIRVMALLPLSALHAQETLGMEECGRETHAVLEMLRTTDYLDKEHFAPLLDRPCWPDALALIAGRPDRFFPFTYR